MERLKLSMIGLDTSHCIDFAEVLNNEAHPHHVVGGNIIVAYPGGSHTFSLSRNRVEQFTSQIRDKFKIKIVNSIKSAVEDVDGIFLESVDGRQHLEQFEKIAPFGKPVFIDKPFATSVKDAKRILELSKKFNSPIFSCSSIRYAHGIENIGKGNNVLGCNVFGPMPILEDFPGFFWYGIHSADVLFSKMGRGCHEVIVHHTETTDVVTGIWKDGRVGILYGYRMPGVSGFGCTVFTNGGIFQDTAQLDPPSHALMMPKIIDFFRTGKSPIDITEILEIMAFLESANKSRQTGKGVSLHI